MYLNLAWRNIWRNKRRTFITMASVFFAVILSSLMMSIKEGTYGNMIDTMVGSYTGYVQIHHKYYWDDKTLDNSMELSDSLESALNENTNIVAFLPRVESFALSASREKTKGVVVVGVDPQKEALFHKLNERVSEGSYFESDEKAVMLGSGLAAYLELKVNDTIVLMGQGFHGNSAAGKYRIKALVKFGSPELSKLLVFLPVKEAQYLYSTADRYSSLVLILSDHDAAKNIASKFNRVGGRYSAKSWHEIVPDLHNMIETDRVEGYVFMFILYMVIAFGIFGTMLMMLAERLHEFGVLIAVGMKRIKLAFVVFLEVITISILGAFMGMLGAIPVCTYFNLYPITFGAEIGQIYEEFGFEPILKASIEPFIFIDQALIVAIIACIIAIYPLVSINRLNAVKAMRS